MPLNLEEKKVVIKQVSTLAQGSISVGVAEYRGLTVEQMTNLRASAIDANVSLRVVKNTLAKKAFKNTACECVMSVLSGPVILGFSQEDPGAVARVFKNFVKENEDLVVRGLGILGDFVEASELKRIANLPTKGQAISLVMALMLAPVEKLARSLNEVPGQVTRVVLAMVQQKQ